MLFVKTQDKKNDYLIYYFCINSLENNTFEIVGLARFNLNETELVHLGYYKYYKQAITIFSEMDYKNNDLMYFKETKKVYIMPENIVDPNVCISTYGGLY